RGGREHHPIIRAAYGAGATVVSTRSFAVTGFGTRPSVVMRVRVLSHPAVSTEPVIGAFAAAPVGRQSAIVAASTASWSGRFFARSGTALIEASTPIDGVAAISFIALSVARTKPATASFREAS